jgi:hypothetical protein
VESSYSCRRSLWIPAMGSVSWYLHSMPAKGEPWLSLKTYVEDRDGQSLGTALRASATTTSNGPKPLQPCNSITAG